MLTDGRRRIISNLTVISAIALNWEQKFSRENRKEKPEPEEKSVPSFSVFFFSSSSSSCYPPFNIFPRFSVIKAAALFALPISSSSIFLLPSPPHPSLFSFIILILLLLLLPRPPSMNDQ